ncbi:MAG: penicillin-binding transpeptidase domain-containing protein [Crocinitomicaceae bacterium]
MRYLVSISVLFWCLMSCGLPKFQTNKSVLLDLTKEEDPKYDFAVVIYDLVNKQYFYYNDSMANIPFSPASTFKIPNTLIGLETGVLKDSTSRLNLGLSDPTLKFAFQNSIVPYYQKLAGQIGDQNMQDYLKRFDYGNKLITPELTSFWLQGDLRISAFEQLDFLFKIEKRQLGLRPETYQTLMDIFEPRMSHPFNLYGKTGWGYQDGKDLGWFVGFADWGKSRYLFATVMTSPGEYYGKFDFGVKRIELTKSAFQALWNNTNF